jgi:hypothetical protein
MEVVGILLGVSLACVFLYFMQKWAYKKEKEFEEMKARIIGDAIISAVEEIKK